jgi:L-fuconate dehydratase
MNLYVRRVVQHLSGHTIRVPQSRHLLYFPLSPTDVSHLQVRRVFSLARGCRDPDYSAAYVILKTDTEGLEGHGLTFTIGRGNDIVGAAIHALRHLVVGFDLETFTSNMGKFWHHITGDSQLRWIGPDKGAIHLATGAVVNAVWDLWGKQLGKPVWKIVSDMSPEERLKLIDFKYIDDAITPDEALEIFRKAEVGKEERIKELAETGYPAYITSTVSLFMHCRLYSPKGASI